MLEGTEMCTLPPEKTGSGMEGKPRARTQAIALR
jgi:hypothetical protein